jgi:ATP-binding cassette, subfamily C, bacterial CydC
MDALDLSRWQFGIATVYGDRLGAALPAAALQLGQSRAATDRIVAVLDTPDPVGTPAEPFPAPQRPVHVVLRGVAVSYGPESPLAVRDIDLDLPPGRRAALARPGTSDDQLAERGGS